MLYVSAQCIAWLKSTKNYLNWLESNKSSYDCLKSTNIDLYQTINSNQQQIIGLESENHQIDHDVTLNLPLSNLEILTTAIQRLTSKNLIVRPWKHLPGVYMLAWA